MFMIMIIYNIFWWKVICLNTVEDQYCKWFEHKCKWVSYLSNFFLYVFEYILIIAFLSAD